MILMGIFFTIPLYLQIVQGLDALETGVRMLPTSVGLFVTALVGSALAGRFAPRTLVRAGLLDHPGRDAAPARHDQPRARRQLLPGRDGRPRGRHGPGHLPARKRRPVLGRGRRPQRGRRDPEHRPAARLLARNGRARRDRDHRPDRPPSRARSSPTRGSPARSTNRSRTTSAPAAASSPPPKSRRSRPEEGLEPKTVEALVDNYEDSQLDALKTALLFAAFLVVGAFFTTRRLPTQRFEEMQSGPDPPASGALA